MQNMKRNGNVTVFLIIILVYVLLIYLYASKEQYTETAANKETKVSANNVESVVYEDVVPSASPVILYKTKIIKKKKLLSKHTITNPNSSDNRNINMKMARKIINGKNKKGYLLKPKDTFSWLEIVGNTTAEKGFKIAPVIVDGKHAEGLGGGVCQVASTINTAVIKAGISTNAKRHSVPVGYLGSDDYEATVSYDSKKDLTFTNTLKYPIRIKVIAKGGSVTVKVFKIYETVKLVKIVESTETEVQKMP